MPQWMILPLSMILAYLAILVIYVPLPLWLSARTAGLHLGLNRLFLMRIRRIPLKQVVPPIIQAYRAGICIQPSLMEAHYLAGGRPALVVEALILAKANRVALAFDEARALDLRGADLLEIARTGQFPAH
jgi:uncharacterized protein YqfA (UPF0365 family)